MSIDASLMSREAKHLLEAALRLPDTQRARLADQLCFALDMRACLVSVTLDRPRG